jgi:hypothetical protein
MTPTPMPSLSSRRTGMPRWIWRALLVVAVLQCAAVLLATLAHIAGLVSEPATQLDGIVAAMAVCVVLLALLLYRHHSTPTTETTSQDQRDDELMAAQLAPDLAPLMPMTWQPIPHLAHDALVTHDPAPSSSTPHPLHPDALKSA